MALVGAMTGCAARAMPVAAMTTPRTKGRSSFFKFIKHDTQHSSRRRVEKRTTTDAKNFIVQRVDKFLRGCPYTGHLIIFGTWSEAAETSPAWERRTRSKM